MNKRDTLLALLAFGVTTGSLTTQAQQAGKLYRIGIVSAGFSVLPLSSTLVQVFRESLRDQGYVEGRDIIIESRYAEGQVDRLPALLAELIQRKADVIVVWSTVGAVAAKKLTSSVPVVFLSVGAPVEIGLVTSLKRPGGNMTGITFEAASETYGKRLQLLKEIIPQLTRVAVLRAAGDANVASGRLAAQSVRSVSRVSRLFIRSPGRREREATARS